MNSRAGVDLQLDSQELFGRGGAGKSRLKNHFWKGGTVRRNADQESTGRETKLPRLERADFIFLPSMVLCVPFIYVDWVGFTVRHPIFGVPWAAYVLAGIVYFLLRFRKRRPSGRRNVISIGGFGNVNSTPAHKGPASRFSFRKSKIMDWLSILAPVVFVGCLLVILIRFA